MSFGRWYNRDSGFSRAAVLLSCQLWRCSQHRLHQQSKARLTTVQPSSSQKWLLISSRLTVYKVSIRNVWKCSSRSKCRNTHQSALGRDRRVRVLHGVCVVWFVYYFSALSQRGKSNAPRGKTVCTKLSLSTPLRTTECALPPSPLQSGGCERWWWASCSCYAKKRCEHCEGTKTVCNLLGELGVVEYRSRVRTEVH